MTSATCATSGIPPSPGLSGSASGSPSSPPVATGERTSGSSATGRTEIADLSDAVVADFAAFSPINATYIGLQGYDRQLDDLSPEGMAGRHQMHLDARAALSAAPSTGPADDVAREVVLERLQVELDRYESGWAHATLNVIASPPQEVRNVFDLMSYDSVEERDILRDRMNAVPAALAGYRASLLQAAGGGRVSAVRQIRKVATQCRTYAGLEGRAGYFTALAGRASGAGSDAEDRTREPAEGLLAAAVEAERAYGELAEFLTSTLLAQAPDKDAVGAERYGLASREFLGATVDLSETYEWGWHEFLTLEAEMKVVADRIAPGQGGAGAATALDADPRYQVQGQQGLLGWMQELSDGAIAELGRTHFEIPHPIKRLECRLAPPGGGIGAYYTGPSDDLSRPGRMWWSVDPDRTDFATWRETTIVYHEGVPGHHLQIATAVHERGQLNDFQRLLATTSGHAEGWALYAERLVRELGYLDDDGLLLGMLDSQLFRAARVVVDIGMHLELPIPAGTGFHEGERWTPELGLKFMLTRTLTDAGHVHDEIDRYLGWPGQAPSYKVGERVWLAGRDDARRRHGPAFDLRSFHTRALRLGSMGLDPLAVALARL